MAPAQLGTPILPATVRQERGDCGFGGVPVASRLDQGLSCGMSLENLKEKTSLQLR